MRESLAKRVRAAIEAEGIDGLTDDQRQCLVDGIVSELQPELDKLREANRERGRISTRLHLARLESKETQSRLQRMVRNANSSGQHWQAKSTMARKAADAAIGTTKRELIERGTRAGREVVLVPPAYTTMTCGSCFARNKQRLTLVERIFRCDSCGHIADRDRNAARVILATVERDRAGVDDVSRSLAALRGCVGTRSDPGILRPLGAQEPLSACDL